MKTTKLNDWNVMAIEYSLNKAIERGEIHGTSGRLLVQLISNAAAVQVVEHEVYAEAFANLE